jgi:hypothetical protein
MLKMFPALFKTGFTLSTMFLQLFEESLVNAGSILLIFKSRFLHASWVMPVDPFFKKVHRTNSGGLKSGDLGGLKSGDLGGRSPRPTMQAPKKSCKTSAVAFTVWSVTPTC